VVSTASDRELVASFLAARCEGSFRALYRAHTPYLLCLAIRLSGGRRDEAEEAVQEAWIRAVERLGGFEERSRLRTWLAGFVINCCREQRRRRPTVPAAAEAAAAVPAAVSASPGARVDLERLVTALPDGQREVLVLHDLEGYTHSEIGARLGIAPGTSKSRLFEARGRLRRWLDCGVIAGERR
jgi:RNA polymerase sigma-70 factor (ECF subfamily)